MAPTRPELIPDLPKSLRFKRPEERFLNRELSWLAFNTRVLEVACDSDMPLLERVKFLAISATNLDEFTMVRIAGLMEQIHTGDSIISDDGLTAREQLELVKNRTGELMKAQQQCWLALINELKAQQIHVLTHDKLNDDQTQWLRQQFEAQLFPVLTPIAIDPAHPFPFLPNLTSAMLFELRAAKRKKRHIAMLPLPSSLPRFFLREEGRSTIVIPLEEAVLLCFDILFPGFERTDHALFRVVRDSDLDIEEEADDLVRQFEQAVRQRRYGRIVRLGTHTGVSEAMLDFMLEHLPAQPSEVVEVAGMLGLASLSELYAIDREELKFKPFKVRFPERITDFGGDCFAAIQAKDIIIHHPYESFDVVVQFLRQAARDPDVISIKQTLYRTSNDSPIVQALIEAAESGKSVTALVELKARFDEEANIRFARRMERAGVQVVYGFVELKTHAKVSLVVRRSEGSLRTYAHLGTGNYHPATAKVYTDLSYFTSDAALCHDVSYLFNYITGYAKPNQFKKLAVAPHNLRSTLLQHIAEEIVHAKAGRPATIWAKMNSLVDPEMIDALYAASQAGVQIELVVRGVCCLRPGIAGLSNNIRVKSLIGRFLEHARIYCFGNGKALPSREAVVYLSSADWMPRNFDSRVEVLVPLENATVHAQVLDKIMAANLHDKANSWQLHADGTYTHVPSAAGDVDAHEYFMTNPSLSGRGKALLQEAGGSVKKPKASTKRRA